MKLQNFDQIDVSIEPTEPSTADEYSNASDLERPSGASSNARPASTTFTDRLGASSHRGGQGFKSPQLHISLGQGLVSTPNRLSGSPYSTGVQQP
jgi:hypothetical protein